MVNWEEIRMSADENVNKSIEFLGDMCALFGGFFFGHYPQGPNGEAGPLKWQVLAVEDGRALLLTDSLIEAAVYHETSTDVTWENCTLRKWMNNDFIDKAFSDRERTLIVPVTHHNPDNPKYETSGGNPTTDSVFVLSLEEAMTYFGPSIERMAVPTEYAKKNGVYVCDDEKARTLGMRNSLLTGEKTGWWWLRSPGFTENYAACVAVNGDLLAAGDDVSKKDIAVRPALWLSLT